MSIDIDQIMAQVKEMSRPELEKFGESLPGLIDPSLLSMYVNTSLGSALKALPPEEKAEAIKSAIQAQPEPERKSLAKQVSAGAMPPPTDGARDRLWLIVVCAFAIVLVGSFTALAVGVFLPASGKVTPELILTMFTSVVGFLAGLFVPSPIANQTRADG